MGDTFFIYCCFSTSVHLDAYRSRSLILAVLFLFHCFTVFPNPFDGYRNCFHFFAITNKTLVNKNLILIPLYGCLLLLFLLLIWWFDFVLNILFEFSQLVHHFGIHSYRLRERKG